MLLSDQSEIRLELCEAGYEALQISLNEELSGKLLGEYVLQLRAYRIIFRFENNYLFLSHRKSPEYRSQHPIWLGKPGFDAYTRHLK
jgi:hypothetical protein